MSVLSVFHSHPPPIPSLRVRPTHPPFPSLSFPDRDPLTRLNQDPIRIRIRIRNPGVGRGGMAYGPIAVIANSLPHLEGVRGGAGLLHSAQARGVPRIWPGGMHIFGWPTPSPPPRIWIRGRFWAGSGSGSASKQCGSTAMGSTVKRLLSNSQLCLGPTKEQQTEEKCCNLCFLMYIK